MHLSVSSLRHVVVLLACLCVVGVLVPAAQAQTSRPDPFGSDPFRAGLPYRGDFPDPAVLRVGRTWFAYATTTGGLNLPVLTSHDLVRWRADKQRRGADSPDAMPAVARWAWSRPVGDRMVGMNWAPSVARIAGQYVAAYATRLPGHRFKMCISVATSASARGPFVDRSHAPLVCPRRRGAIDPQLLIEHHKVWLLYKTEDISIGRPTRLWVQRLGARGLHATAAAPTKLLTARGPATWENQVVENPSMIVVHGRHYLFYSGNGWGSKQYAVGYALCDGVKGPCQRPTTTPLIATNAQINGPGGGFAFLTKRGRLRLAYHAWDKGFTHYPRSDRCRGTEKGCAQRRMHVARLHVGADGLLSAADLGLEPARAPKRVAQVN
ncbi:glycoside hydrolase family 43 protein [Nocardioides terrisoli]|uniref:glycoside hydrolase family 43 protein n=1 Tax=Nocardioides terrisoli TaxID=3388267 RepID=UPI00287BC442|nr:glycoside hydrolase family 43 protein [Nocardioides marmorisolisilvae]